MKTPPVILDRPQRAAVRNAIEEVCMTRGYYLNALNVRTNHAHAVVAAQVKPEFIANSFKSYATRELKRLFLISRDLRPWARGRSRKYLWKDDHVAAAVDYVLYCQGPITFEEWYESRYG